MKRLYEIEEETKAKREELIAKDFRMSEVQISSINT